MSEKVILVAPLIWYQVPVPEVGGIAFMKVEVMPLQRTWFGPAIAVEGKALMVTLTVLVLVSQIPLLMVHLNL